MYVLFDLEWVTAEARRSRMRDHAPAGRQDRRSQLPGAGGLLPQPHPPRQADPQTDGGPRLPGEGMPLPFDIAWAAIILCGVPIILEAIIGLVTEFDIKADVLVSLALIASVCIGETFAAGEVAFIMQLGGLLEELTVAKARAGIEKLVHLTPQTARVLKNGTETVVPAEQVQVGDVLRVLPGETVPVDGVITAGQTSINQAVMTGESLPVDKTVGDEVSSGTVNQFGAFEMRAANAIAGQLSIREVRANCLPQDKLHCIDEFQQKGEPVHNAGSVLVIINSALLLNWRKKA